MSGLQAVRKSEGQSGGKRSRATIVCRQQPNSLKLNVIRFREKEMK